MIKETKLNYLYSNLTELVLFNDIKRQLTLLFATVLTSCIYAESALIFEEQIGLNWFSLFKHIIMFLKVTRLVVVKLRLSG